MLASTDAVLLRDVVNNRRVPLAARHTLSIEAGMNDVIVLPMTLVLASIAAGDSRSNRDWAEFAFDIFILGPLVGAVTAFVAIRAVERLRQRRLIRRDYESLYSLGVAFLAYAGAQLIGGSGFLAAFAAGLTIAIVDVDLCDCFLEYGETTAEMAMLLTFVFLGAALVDAAFDAFGATALLFALLVLVVARPVAFLIALARSRASWSGRLMIAWFGPRGLNTLLLTILAIAVGIPESDRVFGAISVVVLASIIVHGTSATPVIAWYDRKARRSDLPEETMADAGRLLHAGGRSERDVPRITPQRLKERLDAGEPITLLDVRREAAYDGSGRRIPGSIRMEVDEILERLREIPHGQSIVLSCA
jgi:NhaP-type Na+/H+ or K+/H+ antiporter